MPGETKATIVMVAIGIFIILIGVLLMFFTLANLGGFCVRPRESNTEFCPRLSRLSGFCLFCLIFYPIKHLMNVFGFRQHSRGI